MGPRVLCVGQAVQDFVFAVDSMPDRPAKYRAQAFQSIGGGPAATASVAVAKLGGHALLAARLGDDPVADIVIDELTGYGVDCSHVARKRGCGTSVSAVLVDANGERTIVNYLDEALSDDAAWLPEPGRIDAKAVLADTRWPSGAGYALTMARRGGIPAVLDGDLPIPRDGELLRAATHVAFSADGLADYAQIDNPEEALTTVSSQIDAWCCVTVGDRGTLLIENDQLVYDGAHSVSVRDTLGAGDVWHGAFALSLAEGHSPREAVRFAGAAAALKVRNGGGRAGAPTRSDVDDFLRP